MTQITDKKLFVYKLSVAVLIIDIVKCDFNHLYRKN